MRMCVDSKLRPGVTNCNLPPLAMQLRVRSSSPIVHKDITKTSVNKRQARHHNQQSSDWSLSSPTSSNKGSSSLTTSPITSRSSSSSPRRTSTRLSIPSLSSSSSEEAEEEEECDDSSSSIVTHPLLMRNKRSFITSESEEAAADSGEETDSSMIDIMENSDSSPPQVISTLTDATLHGLLSKQEAEIASSCDDIDRKLYELAFNRAELSLQQQMNNFPTSASSNALFKGSRNRVNTSTTSNAAAAGRGKGKDLFSVLKQRARGPSLPTIRKIYFGTDVAINPWYSAPYPSEYHSETGELWICEFCLQYMKKPSTAQRHLLKCHGCLPPGDEIYRDSGAGISVFEINGRDSKLYCQNLCLLAKMFLDHKTLYYDVDPFLFYVLVEWKALGTGRFLNSFVGYFSKEKVNPAGFNVSCILTMPHHQRKGYGSFLIDFSYLLSRREGRLGSPEKPLSDLGLFSYVSYWKTKLLAYFSDLLPENIHHGTSSLVPVPSVNKICLATGMTENDVLSTLEYLRMLRFDILPDPTDSTRQLLKASILIDLVAVESYRSKIAAKPQLIAHDDLLRWQPYKCIK